MPTQQEQQQQIDKDRCSRWFHGTDTDSYPNRTFHNFRVTKTVNRRFRASSNSLIEGCWLFKNRKMYGRLYQLYSCRHEPSSSQASPEIQAGKRRWKTTQSRENIFKTTKKEKKKPVRGSSSSNLFFHEWAAMRDPNKLVSISNQANK